MSDVGSVTVRVILDTSQAAAQTAAFTQQTSAAVTTTTTKTTDAAKKTYAAAAAAGVAYSAAITAPIVSIGKESAAMYAEFDKNMSMTAALLEVPKASLEGLSATIDKVAQDSIFNIEEVQAAVMELAKGGFTAAEIEAGALTTAVNFAAAADINLADAAAFTANAMQVFGISTSDSAKIADIYTSVANKTTASADGLAQGVTNAGGAAAAAGYAFEDLVPVLGLLADRGYDGAESGTMLRRAILAMVSPTTEAQKAMEQYGIEFVNADGSMKDFAEIAQELQEGLGDLTEAERLTTLETIYGTYGLGAAVALYEEGASGLGEYNAMVNAQGIAQRQAASMMDSYGGRMEALSGSIDSMKNAIGKALMPVIAGLADAIAGLADWFTNLNPTVQKIIIAVAALAAGIGPLLIAIGAISLAIPVLAAAFTAMTGPVGLVIIAIAAVATAIGALVASFGEAADPMEALTAESKEQAKEIAKLETALLEAELKYGEFSEEAARARAEVNEATIAFEANRQTLGDLQNAVDANAEAMDKMRQSYKDTMTEANLNYGVTLNLIDRYEELSSKVNLTAAEEAELQYVTEQLANSGIPGLSDAYDELSGTFSITADEMRRLTEAQYDQIRLTAYADLLTEAYKQQATAMINLAEAEENSKAAQDAYYERLAAIRAELDNGTISIWEANKAKDELDAETLASIAIEEDARKAYEESTIAVNNAEAAYQDMSVSINEWEENSAKAMERFGDNQSAWVDEILSSKESYSDILKGMEYLTDDEVDRISSIYDAGGVDAREAFELGMNGMVDDSEKALDSIKRKAKDAMSALRDSFSEEFKPNIKVPTMSLSGTLSSTLSAYLTWNAAGGIFDKPSIIGIGEAGAEAVVPLSQPNLQPFADAVAAAMGGGGNTYVIDGVNYLPDSKMAQVVDSFFAELTHRMRMGVTA
jgi:TP901 family phage tail tape measure protein